MGELTKDGLLVIAASTIAEFYRGGTTTAREAHALNRWDPHVVRIGESEGRLAGELQGAAGTAAAMDALLVAVAQLHGVTDILTTDPTDIKRLVAARKRGSRPIAVIKAD